MLPYIPPFLSATYWWCPLHEKFSAPQTLTPSSGDVPSVPGKAVHPFLGLQTNTQDARTYVLHVLGISNHHQTSSTPELHISPPIGPSSRNRNRQTGGPSPNNPAAVQVSHKSLHYPQGAESRTRLTQVSADQSARRSIAINNPLISTPMVRRTHTYTHAHMHTCTLFRQQQ